MFASNYARYYELFNQDKPYKEEVGFVYLWADKPKSILDVGCGTAHYWKHYPKEVVLTGVDVSRSMACQSKNIICTDVSKFTSRKVYDTATALFDVINYIPRHEWWNKIPVKKGGYWIFDLWDKEKVMRDGFQTTTKKVDDAVRKISPVKVGGFYESVDLKVEVTHGETHFSEIHKMYLYSREDIEKFCGDDFEIVDERATKTWQSWFRLRRR